MEKKTEKYVLLEKIKQYLLEEHIHIGDSAVVIESLPFEKRCEENALILSLNK